jgi:peptidoglycan-associated lipoprotein
MHTILQGRTALRLTLVAAAALSMAACSTRPKPTVIAPTTPPPTTGPMTDVPPPTGAVTQSILPGSGQDFVVNVGDRVYFDTDSYTVRDDALALLDAQAAWLRRYPSVMVRIEGNADERGTREYNLALGGRRANSVRDYLVGHGVTSDRVATISYGKEQPLDAGTGEESWQRNRNAKTSIISGAR